MSTLAPCPKCGTQTEAWQLAVQGYCDTCLMDNFGARPRTEPDAPRTEARPERVHTRPDGLHYHHGEVLAGWIDYELRGAKRVRQDRRLVSNEERRLVPRDAIDEAIDVSYLQWLKVEAFFRSNIQWHLERAALILRRESQEFRSAFKRWYVTRKLAKVCTAAGDRLEDPELVSYPLAEAVEAWNKRHEDEPRRQVRPKVAYDAARERIGRDGQTIPPRLLTWNPEGKKHTTMAEIRRWLDAWPIEHGGKRENAGGKREGAGSGGRRPGAGRKKAA